MRTPPPNLEVYPQNLSTQYSVVRGSKKTAKEGVELFKFLELKY